MLKRMILTSLLAVAAAPVLASDASFDSRGVGPKIDDRTDARNTDAKAAHECQCRHAAPAAVNLPTVDDARSNS